MHRTTLRSRSRALLLGALLLPGLVAQEPAAAPPRPSAERVRQVQDLRFGMFVCWSFSTFSGYEWTPGVEDIDFFAPSGFEPDSWCATARAAGMRYILLLTKHHDGFCLWDTATTDRKVGRTRALAGRDVVAEVKRACDDHGLKLALYFSEGDWSWSPERKDIHRPSAARPEIKKAQLRELLTGYGPIEFLWFDHAIGDGGLPHAETAAFVKSLQPTCLVGFNSGAQDGADLRIGERGKAAPLGAVDAETIGSAARAADMREHRGHLVAEFTYPILEGQQRKQLRGAQWFYSLPENDRCAASPEKIFADYQAAVRHRNLFSLDVGPDRAGRLRAIDTATLRRVGELIRAAERAPR